MSSTLTPGNTVYSIANGAHMVAEVMTADITPDGINCEHFSNIRFQIAYTGVNSPVGVISVQVRETKLDADFVDFPLVSSMVTIVTGDGVIAADGTIDISGVAAGKILLNLNDPFGELRVKYTFGSAGTGDTMDIRVGAR